MARPSMPRRRGRRRGGGFGERPRHRRIAQPLIAFLYDVATLRDKALQFEQRARGVADLAGEALDAARLSDANQGVDQRRTDAAARVTGIDKEHVENRQALQAGEADARAVQARDESERFRKTLGEGRLVVRPRAPGLTLIVVVIFACEFLDAATKNLDAAPGVGRQERA